MLVENIEEPIPESSKEEQGHHQAEKEVESFVFEKPRGEVGATIGTPPAIFESNLR
jgi:hypothetical protein